MDQKFTKAPPLSTKRLKLRAFELKDFETFAAMFQNPDEAKFLGGTLPRGEAWRKFLFGSGHWALLGYGWWVVANPITDEYMGQVGIADFKRDLEPRLADGLPEIGWALLSSYHRRGYATEAVEKVLQWHDEFMPFPKLACIIDPGNLPSLQLAARFGFKQVGQSLLRGNPILRFERALPKK
jgi:RimJ/RimL family protein N-acetyltransferase